MASISRLPMPLQEVYEWQYDGACRGVDPETFFSPDAERGPRRAAREASAKALCAVCPVITECLRHAIKVKEPYGVWGGLNATERDALQARLRELNQRLKPNQSAFEAEPRHGELARLRPGIDLAAVKSF